MDLKSYIKSLKSHWVLLVQAASFICLTVKGFISPPSYFDPVATAAETKRLAAFIVALIVSVFFYLSQRWSSRKHTKGWALITILMAFSLIASDQVFREFKSRCTCRYDEQTVLKGTEYTELGSQSVAKHRAVLPCEDILMNAAGQVNRIWTMESINSCRRNLTLAYLATFSLASLSLLSALQIVKCQKDSSHKNQVPTKKRPKRKKG